MLTFFNYKPYRNRISTSPHSLEARGTPLFHVRDATAEVGGRWTIPSEETQLHPKPCAFYPFWDFLPFCLTGSPFLLMSVVISTCWVMGKKSDAGHHGALTQDTGPPTARVVRRGVGARALACGRRAGRRRDQCPHSAACAWSPVHCPPDVLEL